MQPTKKTLLIVAVASALIGTAPVFADDLDDFFAPPDKTGILPVESVLPQVHESVPGTVKEIDLERKRGRWIYEVDVLANDGRKVEIKIDAMTGNILSQENKFRKPWE
jgi:uncharacterized membrane protein YkoI